MDDNKPFDAVESYLCETEREPCGQWRTVSLVTAMLGILTHGPEFERPTPQARQQAFKAAADELSRRGLDAVALVRYGMAREVLAPLEAALIVGLITDDSPYEGIDVQAWQTALDLQPPPRSSDAQVASGEPIRINITEWVRNNFFPVVSQLHQWTATASLDELVNLTPPTRDAITSLLPGEPGDRALREQYRWAVDHFARTFYRDWNTESLHYELRWLDGDILAPCPDEIMSDRRVPRDQITEEIARRVVYNSGNVDPGESLAEEMTRHAEKLLRQGRYREAAAVFEFGVQQRPEDAAVRNNLGFCLIPVEPREALSHLKAAANMGYEPSATNAYNQMCCYVAVGRSRAALNIADSEYKKPKAKQEGAFLWRSREGQWELFHSESPFSEIAVLAAEIARTEGWKDQEDLWRANIARAEHSARLEADHSAQPKESQESGN